MSEIKLLPCPFCGGEAEFHRSLSVIGDIVTVRCKACQAKTAGILFDAGKHQSDEEYDEAAEAWNNRKPVEDVLERLEEFREEAEQRNVAGMFSDMLEVIKEGLN